MLLSHRELELVAVSTSIAAGCVPCTEYHIAECSDLKIDAQEITGAVRIGAEVADSSLMQIWARFDADVTLADGPVELHGKERQKILCAIGAAVARNNVALLRDSFRASRRCEISDAEIMEVTGLAKRIKDKAASHLEKPINKLNADQSIAEQAANLCT